jgi:hypothetical protein
VNTTKQIPDKIDETEWQSLGEIKLPAGPAADRIIAAWLQECTRPLNLFAEFKDKVMRSTLEALGRALETDRDPMEAIHVVLCLYAPLGFAAKSGRESTWGFFRIEKAESGPKDRPIPGNSIELYLYPEGC